MRTSAMLFLGLLLAGPAMACQSDGDCPYCMVCVGSVTTGCVPAPGCNRPPVSQEEKSAVDSLLALTELPVSYICQR